jgi:hypothetical protein
MSALAGRLSRALLFGAFLALGQVGLANANSPTVDPPPTDLQAPTGDEMLSVVPSLVAVDVRPGGSTSAELTVRAAVPLDVTITPAGLHQASNGSFASVAADSDFSLYSARPMVAVAPTTFRLEPGEPEKVTVTIAVPADAGEGTRYAIIKISALPAGRNENVGIGIELGVTTLVGLTGTPQVRTGVISDLKVGASLPGQPLPVLVTLENTGGTHYGNPPYALTTTATLQDEDGNLVASGQAALSGNSIVPGFSRELTLQLDLARPPSPGSYRLEVGAGLEDGTVLDRKALDFEWAGGEVLGATPAPPQGPAGTGGPTDALILIVAGIVAAAVAILVLAILLRPRRPRRGSAGEGTGE